MHLFVKTDDGQYRLVNRLAEKLYNHKGGYIPMSKKKLDEYLSNHVLVQAEDWTDLFNITGYNPLKASINENDLWVAPSGKVYEGDGHISKAEDICEIFGYDKLEDYCEYSFDAADDYLLSRGWIKISSFFWDMHLEDNPEWEMTQEQANTVFDWCRLHRYEYPVDNIKIKEY